MLPPLPPICLFRLLLIVKVIVFTSLVISFTEKSTNDKIYESVGISQRIFLMMEQTRKWNTKFMFQACEGWKTSCIWVGNILEVSLHMQLFKFNDGAVNFNNGARDLMMEHFHLTMEQLHHKTPLWDLLNLYLYRHWQLNVQINYSINNAFSCKQGHKFFTQPLDHWVTVDPELNTYSGTSLIRTTRLRFQNDSPDNWISG